jgi:type II secretory pathway component PulJ
MKTYRQLKAARERGNALLLVMMTTVISAIALAGAMQWVSTNAQLTSRNNEYYRAVAAAEAATEKVVGMMARDFREHDWSVVDGKLADYRAARPTESESAHWQGWAFSDPSGSTNGVYVARRNTAQFVELNSQYTGLRGMAATYSVIANASQVASQHETPITAAIRQQFQLATIPIFQFAIFYGIPMEIHPGPNFVVTGRVHSNDALYYSGNPLTFNSHVTSVGTMVNAYAPGDTDHTGTPGSNVNFVGEADQHTAHLHLPIGTNNTAAAVREILMPPPVGESMNSAMGLQRYYNKADMIITVANTGVTVTSGPRHTPTVLSTNDWQKFVTTTNSFRDWREEKTVLPVDINVAALRQWSNTNGLLRLILPGNDVASVYVDDKRTLASGQMAAVRLREGAELPEDGLTVATAQPLYIQGNFNQPNSSHLGTTNTTATKPASIASDAITILSGNWQDANSTSSDLGTRVAANTTVNAALLSGIVPTLDSNRAKKYSGGVENYTRLLEKWSGRTFTYNGSMVVLFNSQFATNGWRYGGSIYEAPTRRWAFDLNFTDPTKLPPGTPRLSAMIRGSWAVLPVGSTNSVYEAEVINIGGGG